MSNVTKMQDWVGHFLGERNQWPDDLPDVDHEEVLFDWASDHASSRLNNPYLTRQWLRRMMDEPLPIGERSIREHPYFRNWSRLDLQDLSKLALFPGNESLDVVITGSVNGTLCEVLFVWERFYPAPGIFDWRPLDPQFRITGIPDDPLVLRLLRSVRSWRREQAALPNPKAGRPRVAIEYELARELWLEHEDRFGQSTYITLAGSLSPIIGRTVSPKTIQRRVQEWQSDGLQWPPTPNQ